MKRLLCTLIAILLLTSSVPAYAENSPEQPKDMILYYGCYGEAADEEIEELLVELKAADADSGKLWEGIMDYWRYAIRTWLSIRKSFLKGFRRMTASPSLFWALR